MHYVETKIVIICKVIIDDMKLCFFLYTIVIAVDRNATHIELCAIKQFKSSDTGYYEVTTV